MANNELDFAGINLEEDTLHIPILTECLKILHLWLPTMFTPFLLKVLGIFIITPMLIMWCFAWSNKKCHENLNQHFDVDHFLKKKQKK